MDRKPFERAFGGAGVSPAVLVTPRDEKRRRDAGATKTGVPYEKCALLV